jgi:hypothetical protein
MSASGQKDRVKGVDLCRWACGCLVIRLWALSLGKDGYQKADRAPTYASTHDRIASTCLQPAQCEGRILGLSLSSLGVAMSFDLGK